MNMSCRRFGFMVGSILVVLILLASSCAPAPQPQKEIIVGMHAAFTGPLASTVQWGFNAQLDYMHELNDNGGIDGVKLSLIWQDDGCSAPRAVPIYRRFKEAGAVLVTHWLSTATELMAPRHQRDKIPGIMFSGAITHPMVTEPVQWVFASNPGYAGEFAVFANWLKKDWTESRPIRIGFLHTETAQSRESADYLEDVAALSGCEVVSVEYVPIFGVIDTSTEVLRLKGKNPDAIYCLFWGSPSVVIIKDVARLGLKEEGIKCCAGTTCLDEVVLGIVGDDAEGWYTQSPLPFAGDPELEQANGIAMLDALDKYRGWEYRRNYCMGWSIMVLIEEVLRSAIDEVGLENLNGEAVRNAFVNIKDFDTGFMSPVTMNEGKPHYQDNLRVYQVQDGNFVRLSDWLSWPRIPAYSEWGIGGQ